MGGELRIGIIGMDTSHIPAFTRLLNDPHDPYHVPGGRVVAALPTFSADLPKSCSRVEGFKTDVAPYDVRLVNTMAELLDHVDAVLLESVDGRRHLPEAQPVIEAGLPLFIDKPLAHNYADACEIARLAEQHNVRIMSSSSLRFAAGIADVVAAAVYGQPLACDAYSPAELEPTNPGLFWYGVHACEILYTVMGSGCRSVHCQQTPQYTLVTADWGDDRLCTLRGSRCGTHSYGATIHGTEGVAHVQPASEPPMYAQLLKKVIPFLAGAPSPVPMSETLEMMAFMQAALLSLNEQRPVELTEIKEQ